MEASSYFAILVIFCCSVAPSLKSEPEVPRGHGEELGRHRDPEGHIPVLHDVPSPLEFWEKYASQRKPVLLRGVAKNFPAYSLWTDEYLRENYGELKVKLEAKVEKDHYPVGEKGLAQDTIRNFLKTYKNQDKYIVSQLPDPMSKEVMVLPCVRCGSFKNRALEANLWLSSGGTKSLLHKDADNAFNCLLNGTKDWILIDPEHEVNVPMAEEAISEYGGFSLINVDRVNLQRYPDFAKVPWWYANITAGDCLWLPYSYLHQVRSYGTKNMAVSVLFSRLKEFDSTGCDTAKPEYTPLSEADMVWTYDGIASQTMGNTDPFELNETLVDWCEENKDKILDATAVLEGLKQMQAMEEEEDENFEVHDVDILEEISHQVMMILDPTGTGSVSCDRLTQLTVAELKAVAEVMSSDPANTEQYEYKHFSPEQVRSVIMLAYDADSDRLELEAFIKKYQEALHGSEKIAREVFEMLDPENKGYANKDDLKGGMSQVLDMFTPRQLDDPAGIQWQHAKMEDEMFRKDAETPMQTHSRNAETPMQTHRENDKQADHAHGEL
ncbi:uncharacterized protein LOC118431132 isoform X2 [Branchiostoma floridae]|uniref:Uncharacterized protein LOC118431132 isoform X2 n=1 Tax=Branchiostoma floridae TaxID=7739 RepID=A0A9J7MBR3_BRAFL|nr:uncharacterized protein LOC118431132 isoform X2 [Branchiostoma floridae]